MEDIILLIYSFLFLCKIGYLRKTMSNFLYYQAIALLYEKEIGDGIISELTLPQSITNMKYNSEIINLLYYGGDSTDYLKTIGKIIRYYELNKNFCQKIKNSYGLRFMLCNNFHDAFIEKFELDKTKINLFLNCGDCLSKPILNNEKFTHAQISFNDIKNFYCTHDNNLLVGLDYVKHSICISEDDTDIFLNIELCKQFRGQITYYYLTFNCQDIQIIKKN